MLSVNDKILDEITGHSVDLQRLEAFEKERVLRELKKLEKSLVKELNNSNMWKAKRNQTKLKRLNVLLKQTKQTIKSTYVDISKNQLKTLAGVASLAENQAIKSINKAIKFDITSTSMSKQMLKAIASDTLIEGAPSKEWWSRRGKAFQARFSDTIRQGMLRGDDTATITRALIGTTKNKFKDGALQINRRSAEALVRTSIQSVANESRLMTYADNDDVIKEVEWVSTLDNRTTQTCMALDGLKWKNPSREPVGHSTPFVGTTAHWGCRSTQVPITKSWEELGAKGKFNEIPESTRASMDGQVSDKLSYEGWLKTKPKEFQREVLGAKKFDLWSKGNLKFTDMVNQSGNALTLEQLGVKLGSSKKLVKSNFVIDKAVKEVRQNVDDIIDKARDDFVSQWTVYHGGDTKFVAQLNKNPSKIKTLSGAQKEAGTGGNRLGLSTTSDYQMANDFAMSQGGDVATLYIHPSARVLNYKGRRGEFLDDLTEKELKKIAKDYDVVRDINNIGGENELRILNPDILGTKSQIKSNFNLYKEDSLRREIIGEAIEEVPKKKTIYHGTPDKFDDFDIDKTMDGTIWFSDTRELIEDGLVGASGKSTHIMERVIDESKLKLGGWDEIDIYSVDELINMGYDGMKYVDDGSVTYQIFFPEKLSKIVKKTKGKGLKLMERARLKRLRDLLLEEGSLTKTEMIELKRLEKLNKNSTIKV